MWVLCLLAVYDKNDMGTEKDVLTKWKFLFSSSFACVGGGQRAHDLQGTNATVIYVWLGGIPAVPLPTQIWSMGILADGEPFLFPFPFPLMHFLLLSDIRCHWALHLLVKL